MESGPGCGHAALTPAMVPWQAFLSLCWWKAAHSLSDVCFCFNNTAHGLNCGTQGLLLKGTFALGSFQHPQKFRLAPRPLPASAPVLEGSCCACCPWVLTLGLSRPGIWDKLVLLLLVLFLCCPPPYQEAEALSEVPCETPSSSWEG